VGGKESLFPLQICWDQEKSENSDWEQEETLVPEKKVIKGADIGEIQQEER